MNTPENSTQSTGHAVDFAGIADRLDAVVQLAPSVGGTVPGVVAGATGRDGDLYLGAAGVRDLGTKEPMTVDTVHAIFSTTKAITATAAMQLYEQGDLDLQAPASQYAPWLAEVQVLDGWDGPGKPRLRAPKRPVTTHDLLTHQAGFAYNFFDQDYLRLTEECGQPPVTDASMAALQTPLVFDPGENWEYGTNLDWAGQVVEGITGKKLGEVFAERIFAPLGMESSSFEPGTEMTERVASFHQRGEDGSLTPIDGYVIPIRPQVHLGGAGLYSTVGDYLKFIRMWLNDGSADDGTQVLKPETVDFATANHLGDRLITPLPGVIPSLSNDAEFFPGQPKSWSYGFMINNEDAPTGRPAGSQGWAGLANLYYWIDRKNGLGGFWATQILPFADADSFGGYLRFESAAYDK